MAASENFSGRRFLLKRTLGEGTFGCVYLAEMSSQGGFRKQVALKVLNPGWDPESDAGRRLRDEARLLGWLNHRNIVRVDDLVRLEGRWGLVMEYIPGADMDAVIVVAKEKGGWIPARVAVEVGLAVADALHEAWTASGEKGQLQVVHRDIKPSNILISEAGDIKVLDFGVARANFEGREAKTERVRYGSLGYMAPERVLGGAETPAGDIYALGVVLYEALTLQPLGRAELTIDAHQKKVEVARTWLEQSLGEQSNGWPGKLVELVRQCLDFDPESRPAASGVAASLREALRYAPGDDTATFARAFIPTVRERLGRGTLETSEREIREDISEVLSKSTLILSSPHPLPASPSRLPLFAALAAAGVVAILAGVALIPVLFGQSSQSGPTLTPTPVVALQTPTPAPTPTETPTVPPAPTATPELVQLDPATPTPKIKKPKENLEPQSSPTPVAVATPEPEPTGPTLRAVKFALSSGSGISARCGGVSGSGDASVLLKDVPAGTCTVSAGRAVTSVTVREPGGFTCSLEENNLTCR